jgi:hypothetical protein
MPFLNVLETYPLFDTVCVYRDLADLATRPPGWFASFAAMGQAIDIPFFNQRNVASAGPEYCNLETRDQTPWPFVLKKVNIHFFAPSNVGQDIVGQNEIVEYKHSALWELDLPRHFGYEVSVNTDVRHSAAAMMPGAGTGPVGGGYGHLALSGNGPATDAPSAMQAGGQGEADRRNGFVLPVTIDIPKKAAISVTLKPSEYARRVLQNLAGPWNISFNNAGGGGYRRVGALFGIRVTLHGTRGVQQRGEAHA